MMRGLLCRVVVRARCCGLRGFAVALRRVKLVLGSWRSCAPLALPHLVRVV